MLPQIDGDIVLSLFPCGNVALAADPVPTELYHCEDEFGPYESSFPCDKTPETEACKYCGSPKLYDEESDEFYCPNMSWCDKCNAWKHIDEHDHNEEDEEEEEEEENGTGNEEDNGGGMGHTPGSPSTPKLKQIPFASNSYTPFLGDCMKMAIAIINKMKPGMNLGGSNCIFQTAKAPEGLNKEQLKVNNELVFDPASASAAWDCIIEHIEKGRPIIIGVDEKIGFHNPDYVTDHFLVVYGYGSDENGDYILYVETGTGKIEIQFNNGNKLYFDGRAIIGLAHRGTPTYTYIVTQVRPNLECPQNEHITSY